MKDAVEVPSPCVGICIIGSAGWCIGCFRDRHELRAWSLASTEDRLAILARCRKRERLETGAGL
jgi:uncharacterized protein